MSHKTIAVSVAALLLGLSSPALAQSFTLNGTAVPTDQVERLQAHCDALEAAEMGSATDSGSGTETSTAAGSGEATTGTDATADATPDAAGATATTGTSTGNDATAAAGATGTAADTTTGSGTAAGAGSVDFAALDLATVDIEACRAGGFLEMSGMNAGSSTGTDAGGTSTTQTTTN